VKEEVDRLLNAGFIQPCRYAEWVSNIVPVEKKNIGKIWVCVDFQDLNRVALKDKYQMPVADILINSALANCNALIFIKNKTLNIIYLNK
jgi:hypothetical protein